MTVEPPLRLLFLDGRCVSSVSETGPDTPVYPVYLTVTKLLLMRCVSSVSEAGADTQCIWCIWGPQPVYLPSRVGAKRIVRKEPFSFFWHYAPPEGGSPTSIPYPSYPNTAQRSVNTRVCRVDSNESSKRVGSRRLLDLE